MPFYGVKAIELPNEMIGLMTQNEWLWKMNAMEIECVELQAVIKGCANDVMQGL